MIIFNDCAVIAAANSLATADLRLHDDYSKAGMVPSNFSAERLLAVHLRASGPWFESPL